LSNKAPAKVVAFAAAAMFLAPAAQADMYQDRLNDLRAKFKASDTNKDGSVTLAQFGA
jgi:hypothetical protein